MRTHVDHRGKGKRDSDVEKRIQVPVYELGRRILKTRKLHLHVIVAHAIELEKPLCFKIIGEAPCCRAHPLTLKLLYFRDV